MSEEFEQEPFALSDVQAPILAGGEGTTQEGLSEFVPPPPRRPWWPYALAAVGALVVVALVAWLIIWLVSPGQQPLLGGPGRPEDTLNAYYRALEKMDVATAQQQLDPTAESGGGISWMELVRQAEQGISQITGKPVDVNLPLTFANLRYTPLAINRDLALFEIEFDIQLGGGEGQITIPTPIHVKERRTLRVYEGRWYIEP